jgi:hypothetical protein
MSLTMKIAHSLALLITTAFTMPFALANFHVVKGIAPGGGAGLEACPSNYYNCHCLRDGDRAVQIVVNGKGVGSLPSDAFSTNGDLCGVGQLNFYKQSDGHWDFYVNDGDGTLQGTCYSNTATTLCSGFYFFDELVCYSYICGQ